LCLTDKRNKKGALLGTPFLAHLFTFSVNCFHFSDPRGWLTSFCRHFRDFFL